MRPSGDPDWYEQRARVPLTGREPLLGRLQQRLRDRTAAWGWVTLEGPRGAGATRMLDEVDALVSAEGGAPLLRVQPAPISRRPMAGLRHALRLALRRKEGLALQREIRAIWPGSQDEVRFLAAWLGPRTSGPPAPAPDPEMVRDLLARIVPRGPVLVDRLDELDAPSLEVLLPSAGAPGPGVLAVLAGGTGRYGGGTMWSLDPLGTPQVELLLRRWLRHPVTARRLASVLTERCGGWPGRIVQAVRQLGRQGHLERRDHRVVLARAPTTWPDGTEARDVFLEWVEAEGAQALRVLDVAAVLDGPGDVELLATAAGVKPRYVRAMLAEAAATHGWLGAGRLFATRAARRAWHERLSDTRREEARRRLTVAQRTAPAPREPDVRPGGDVLVRARSHESLAARAAGRERTRAAEGHRLRAARLHLAAGDLLSGARLLVDVAKQEIRRGRLHLASAPLERAAEIFRMHGDLPSASEAWFRLGRVYAWRHAHGEAARFLGAALRAAEAGGQGTQLPRIHLALAAACRGCGDLHGERHHAELAAALAATALGRIQAAAVLARADLCSGKPGAERMLARCEADLRQAGFPEEADRARAALVDARLRAGDAIQAAQILPPGPERAVERLAAARLDLAAGEVAEACAALELLGSDACLPVALRAMCYAQLADALRWEGRLQEARGAAVAAAALLLVERRDRSEDIQLHAVLARVFRGVGDPARAVGHRSQARQRMRALLRTARTPREGRRLLRALHVREVTVDRRAG